MDFFGSPLKTFPLVITILAAIELIEKMEEIKKNIRTWDCGTSRYRALKEGGHKCALLLCLVFYKKAFL